MRLIDEVETRIDALERMGRNSNPTVTQISSNRELLSTGHDVITPGRAPIDQRLDITPRL